MSRRVVILVLAAALAAAGGLALMSWLGEREAALPDGIVSGNGRIEARQISIAPRTAARVLEVLATEGDLVAPETVLARMDTAELEAERDRAEAEAALARESLEEAKAVVLQRESELRLADQVLERAVSLVERGHLPEATFEARQSARDVAQASLNAAKAAAATAERRIAAAEAEVHKIEEQIEDATLIAPTAGRVLYRLAAPGEVVAAGQPVITLLDLADVYMEIFLPAMDAGRIALGDEARIALDVMPGFAIPATVSFVSPEAQFTPKQVETLEEREKLVFRVRLRIPPDLVERNIEHVKTGLRGVGYVKLRPSVAWPERLERRIPPEVLE